MIEWIVFLVLAVIAVVTAAGMLVTMSMVRAGLALMSCFVALACLFVLLDADLLAAIQIMMNVGGMLVMIVFMVMMMMDPGGEMMWDMKRKMRLRGPGALSMRMPPETTSASDMSMGHPPADGGNDHATQHHQMMQDMAMSTAQLPWAIAIGVATAIVLVVLAVRTPWPVSGAVPTRDAASAIGELLLSRYMIAFEGAALLIFAGIAGAVIFGKREIAHAVPPVAEPANPMHQAVPRDAVFTCPMHPEIRANAPGKCPKCGMTLIPATHADSSSSGHQ